MFVFIWESLIRVVFEHTKKESLIHGSQTQKLSCISIAASHNVKVALSGLR